MATLKLDLQRGAFDGFSYLRRPAARDAAVLRADSCASLDSCAAGGAPPAQKARRAPPPPRLPGCLIATVPDDAGAAPQVDGAAASGLDEDLCKCGQAPLARAGPLH